MMGGREGWVPSYCHGTIGTAQGGGHTLPCTLRTLQGLGGGVFPGWGRGAFHAIWYVTFLP